MIFAFAGAAGFIASTVKLLPETDVWCTLYPALRKMLKADISQVDEISILGASVGPVSASDPFLELARRQVLKAQFPINS